MHQHLLIYFPNSLGRQRKKNYTSFLLETFFLLLTNSSNSILPPPGPLFCLDPISLLTCCIGCSPVGMQSLFTVLISFCNFFLAIFSHVCFQLNLYFFSPSYCQGVHIASLYLCAYYLYMNLII